MMPTPRTKHFLSLAACALLIACGGSSSSGGPPASTPAFSQGAVQRFGSIFVNGVEWRTQGGTLLTPDDSTTSRSLSSETEIQNHVRPGDVVRVTGRLDADGRHGQATEIEFHHSLSGAVSALTPDGFVVAGVRVHVEAETHHHGVGGADDRFSTRPVAVGNLVRVSGTPDDKGGLRASSVRDDSSATQLEAKGYVLAAPSGGTFPLALTPGGTAALTVNVSGVASLPTLTAGTFVEVRGTSVSTATLPVLTATSVSLEDDVKGEAQMEAEVEGIVTSGAAASFNVGGQAVTTSASTRWVGAADPANPTADFAVGIKVEAEGRLDASGVLVADKVKFKDSARVTAAITQILVPQAGETARFTALGRTIALNADTDTTSAPALAVGTVVEFRGYPQSDNVILAQRVRPPSGGGNRAFILGVVTTKTEPSVTILQTTVNLTGAEFRAEDDTPLTQAAFFNAITAGSTLVKVRWNNVNGTGTPDQAEIEAEDG